MTDTEQAMLFEMAQMCIIIMPFSFRGMSTDNIYSHAKILTIIFFLCSNLIFIKHFQFKTF